MSTSAHHEILIELLRQAPEPLLEHLWRHRQRPRRRLRVEAVSTDLTRPVPIERRVDLVLRLGQGKKPRLVLGVEVQLKRDRRKNYTWPEYLVALRSRYKCSAELIVVAPEAGVAGWAAQVIALNETGSVIRPLVLGPSSLPAVEPERLAGQPHAAMFYTLLQCRSPRDVPLFQQTLASLESLPEPERIGYYEILRNCLTPSFLALAEVAMGLEQSRWYKSFVKNLKAEGRAEGRKSELLRVISRQLGRRLALPGPSALSQMEALSIETLEDLAEDLLDFTAPSDLDAWLARLG